MKKISILDKLATHIEQTIEEKNKQEDVLPGVKSENYLGKKNTLPQPSSCFEGNYLDLNFFKSFFENQI